MAIMNADHLSTPGQVVIRTEHDYVCLEQLRHGTGIRSLMTPEVALALADALIASAEAVMEARPVGRPS